MQLTIGSKISEGFSIALLAALNREDMKEIADKVGMSFHTVDSVLRRKRRVTLKNSIIVETAFEYGMKRANGLKKALIQRA